MTWLIVALIVVVLVIGVLAVPQLRSRTLKRRFGPEYDRVVDVEGDRRSAEGALRERVKRHDTLEIHDLDPEARQAYTEQWLVVQQRFIDEPAESVAEADDLVQKVMRERGYPVDDFDERIDMVSVDHPELADNYRAAHAVQLQGEATTDDLREAIKRYRALFAELLDNDELPERGAQ